MNDVILAPNLAHKDPVKREMYNQKLFRQALSVAIDRQAIIDTLLLGLGQPHQAAPRPESEFYDEEFATQFTQYDPDQANAWLDELGYTRGADGFRVGPDGAPIAIALETSQDMEDALQLVIRDWEAVGIKANLALSERSLFRERTDNNDHDWTAWNGEGGLGADVMLEPRWYLPFSTWSFFGIPWQYWRTGTQNTNTEEPPAEIKRQIELYEQIKLTADPEEQKALMREVLAIAKEQFYAMGITLPANSVGIARNNFRNIPDAMYSSFSWPQPAVLGAEQFFIEQ